MDVRNRNHKKVCEITTDGKVVIVVKGVKTILIPEAKGKYKVVNE